MPEDLHFPSWIRGYLTADPSRPDHKTWSFIEQGVNRMAFDGDNQLLGAAYFAKAVSTRAENAVPSPSQWVIFRGMLESIFLPAAERLDEVSADALPGLDKA